jgi:hypothetical protein
VGGRKEASTCSASSIIFRGKRGIPHSSIRIPHSLSSSILRHEYAQMHDFYRDEICHCDDVDFDRRAHCGGGDLITAIDFMA